MRRLTVLLLALAVIGVACGGGEAGPTADTSPAATPLERLTGGQPLPETSLAMLDRDGTLTREDLLGTPTVINFWATWCPFCVDEMPDLEAVHQQLGERVQFVGVDREDARDKARTLVEETGVTYTLVEDPDGSYFRALRARGMPTTVFVDADGVIRHRHAGPLDAEQLRELIAEHLGVP